MRSKRNFVHTQGFLECDALQFAKWTATFRKNLLLLYSGLTLLPSRWRHQPNRMVSPPGNTISEPPFWISSSAALTGKAAKRYEWHISAASAPLWLPVNSFPVWHVRKVLFSYFSFTYFLSQVFGSVSLHNCQVLLHQVNFANRTYRLAPYKEFSLISWCFLF